MLREAHAVDMKYDEGGDIKPLCGLTFAVKDLYDVQGYHTVAGTPALAGEAALNCCTAQVSCSMTGSVANTGVSTQQGRVIESISFSPVPDARDSAITVIERLFDYRPHSACHCWNASAQMGLASDSAQCSSIAT